MRRYYLYYWKEEELRGNLAGEEGKIWYRKYIWDYSFREKIFLEFFVLYMGMENVIKRINVF